MQFKYFLAIVPLIFLFSGCQRGKINQNSNQQVNRIEITNESENDKDVILKNKSTSTPPLKPLDQATSSFKESPQIPKAIKTLDYPVPFATQAPFGVWDELHKEACEEAAMIMVAKYFKKEPINPHLMEQAILNLVKWEKENGYQVDSTADEIVKILADYFKINARLVTEVTVENIKKELAAGNLIIVPAAGRELGNPYFRQPGPIYHMLVIRGYNEKEFITNDPGTKRGEGFKYKYQKLIGAIHDWDHQLAEGGMTDQEIEQGRKVMIVVQN